MDGSSRRQFIAQLPFSTRRKFLQGTAIFPHLLPYGTGPGKIFLLPNIVFGEREGSRTKFK